MTTQQVRHGGGSFLFFRSFIIVAILYLIIAAAMATSYRPWNVSTQQIFFVGLIAISAVMSISYPLGRRLNWSRTKFLEREVQKYDRLAKAYSQYKDTYSVMLKSEYEHMKESAKFHLEALSGTEKKKIINGLFIIAAITVYYGGFLFAAFAQKEAARDVFPVVPVILFILLIFYITWRIRRRA